MRLPFEVSHLALTSNLLDITNNRFHTIETEAATSVTPGVISIQAALGDNGRFREEHMRVCGMLRRFSMLWEHDLAADAHGNLDPWARLIKANEITEWRILLNEWRQPGFPDALRAIISVAWTQAHWAQLWTHTRTEWNHLIEVYDEMINDKDEETEEEN